MHHPSLCTTYLFSGPYSIRKPNLPSGLGSVPASSSPTPHCNHKRFPEETHDAWPSWRTYRRRRRSTWGLLGTDPGRPPQGGGRISEPMSWLSWVALWLPCAHFLHNWCALGCFWVIPGSVGCVLCCAWNTVRRKYFHTRAASPDQKHTRHNKEQNESISKQHFTHKAN